MKRIFALAALMLCSIAGFGQGGHVDLPAIFSQSASPMQIPGIPIIACLSTATVTNGTCSPTVPVFSDQALQNPIANLQTNGDGLFPFWIAPGNYLYCGNDTAGRVANFCNPFTVGVAPGSAPSFSSLTLPEGIAPTCASGFDCLYGDSSLHRPRFINNAGAAVSVALLSDPLTAFTGTFTSAQLAALITDETGAAGGGVAVFNNAPSIISPTTTGTDTGTETLGGKTINNGGLAFAGSVSGSTTIKGGSAASGTATLPVGSGTIIEDGLTQTMSGKSLASPFQGLTVVDTITSPIVFSVHSLLNTATNSGNFASANAVAGTYEVGGYIYVSTAGTSGTVGLSFAYNNGASQAINSVANANLGTLGSNAFIPTQIVQIAANTTFGWGATVTTGVGTFKYDVHLIVRRIN